MSTKISTISPGMAREYSTSSEYAVDEYVLYRNAYWRCIVAIPSGGEAWNPAHWSKDEEPVENLRRDVAAKADDSGVVHKTGDETVSGHKTFSGEVTVGPTDFYVGETTLAAILAGKQDALPLAKGASGKDATLRLVVSGSTQNQATADRAVALGYQTRATGNNSLTEGRATTASGAQSHAEGHTTEASGVNAHAEGFVTFAQNAAEHAQGRYNVSRKNSDSFGSSGNTHHSIGIGTSVNDRRNAVEVMQNGDVYVDGVGGYVGGDSSLSDKKTLQTTIDGKADKVVSATAGNLAGLDSDGNLTDSGKAPSDFASSALVPAGTTELNPLVNQQELNDAVQTNAAHYRGYFATWSDVPTDPAEYKADSEGNTTPGPNDYLAVGDMSDYPVEQGEDPLSGAWRMTYSGSWALAGRNGWSPAFQYNESPLSPQQQAALDSGITSAKVGKLDELPDNDALTQDLSEKRDLTDLNVYEQRSHYEYQYGGQTYVMEWVAANTYLDVASKSSPQAGWIYLVWNGTSSRWEVQRGSTVPGEGTLQGYSKNGEGVDAATIDIYDTEGISLLFRLTKVQDTVATGDTLAKTSELPAASTATPQMADGDGSAGVANSFSRGDHVHLAETEVAEPGYVLPESAFPVEFHYDDYDFTINADGSWEAVDHEFEHYTGKDAFRLLQTTVLSDSYVISVHLDSPLRGITSPFDLCVFSDSDGIYYYTSEGISNLTFAGESPVQYESPVLVEYGYRVAVRDVEVATREQLINELAGKLNTSGGTVAGELEIGPNTNLSAVFLADASNAMSLLLRDSIGNQVQISGTKVAYQRYDQQTFAEIFWPTKDGTLGLIEDLPSNLPAAQGGTSTSLVTTGDKYNWNGKADAADLRYRIAEVGSEWKFATSAFPITYGYNGATVTITASDAGDIEFDTSGGEYANVIYNGVLFCYYTIAGVGPDVSPEVSDLRFNGVEYGNAKNLLVKTLADRTVNLITADDETSIDIELPEPQSGRSRDFYVAVTCGSTAPTFPPPSGVTLVNAKGEEPDLTLTPDATTVLRFTEVKEADTAASPATTAVFCVTGGANGGGSVEVDDHLDGESANPVENSVVTGALNSKLNSTAAGPDFRAGGLDTVYFASDHITYLGVLYECVVPYTATSSSPTPNNDIYNASVTPATGHWKVTDMTSPDATLDITAAGALRVVSAAGDVLWQQGYTLKTTSSATQDNEAVNKYDFAQDATAPVALTLPTPTGGKAGDFILDITNPLLGTEFSDAATYAVGDRVLYNGAVWTCTTAHTGAWSDADFGTDPTYAAFSASSTYAVGNKVVYDGKLWDCTTAVDTAGAWTGSANWQTASFTIAGLGATVSVVVPEGENLSDMLTIAPGYTELYFTTTAFAVGGRPTWRLMRMRVEAGS